MTLPDDAALDDDDDDDDALLPRDTPLPVETIAPLFWVGRGETAIALN